MSSPSEGRDKMPRAERQPEKTGPDWGSARAGMLEELREALAQANQGLETMTKKSGARSESDAEHASAVSKRARNQPELREMANAARDEAKAEARAAKVLGEAHRDVVSALLDDLARLLPEQGGKD